MTSTTFFLLVIFLGGLFIGVGLTATIASLMYYKAVHGGLKFDGLERIKAATSG